MKEKNKACFFQRLGRCGSSAEWDLWCISVTGFSLFCVVEHHVSKINFCFSANNSRIFFRYIWWPETDIFASSDSIRQPIYIVFFNDTSWLSAAALLVTQGLLSSLHRSYVCSNMFLDFLTSYRFRRYVSAGFHCHFKIVTWMFLDLAATSSSLIFLFCFLVFFRTTWISSTLVKGMIPFFCPCLFIDKLNRAVIFSSQKGSAIYDCHLLEYSIYT